MHAFFFQFFSAFSFACLISSFSGVSFSGVSFSGVVVVDFVMDFN